MPRSRAAQLWQAERHIHLEIEPAFQLAVRLGGLLHGFAGVRAQPESAVGR